MSDSNIVLIEFFITEEKILIFIVRKEFNEPKLIEVNVSKEEINYLVDSFVNKLRGNSLSDLIDPCDELSELWNIFVKPIMSGNYLKKEDYVYIVPHDALHYLPFHAFKHEKTYLGEHHPIIYVPNTTVIAHCQTKRKKTKETCSSFGVGLKNDTNMMKKVFHDEAEWVAKLFNTNAIIDTRATKMNSLNEIKDKDVIHFACHAQFCDKEPLDSGLVLFEENNHAFRGKKIDALGDIQGSILRASEILKIELNTNLVTLSACDTGINKIKPGDELIGLSRAFFYAGAPTLLVSLWQVNTYSTQMLMKKFYHFWKNENLSKIEALHKAQEQIMNITAYDVISYYQEERHNVPKNGALFDSAFIDSRIGDTYLELNFLKEAERYYLSAQKAYNNLGMHIDEADIWFYLGVTYERLGKNEKSNKAFNNSTKIYNLENKHNRTPRATEVVSIRRRKTKHYKPQKKYKQKDIYSKIYRHPLYWAPFILIGDWK